MLYQFPEFLYENRLWLSVKGRKLNRANLVLSESQGCVCREGVAIWKRGCVSQVSRRHCSPVQFQRQAVSLSPRGAVMLESRWAERVWQFVLRAATIPLFHGLFIERNQNKTLKGLFCFHKWLFSTKPQMTLEFSLCEPYVFHRKLKQNM